MKRMFTAITLLAMLAVSASWAQCPGQCPKKEAAKCASCGCTNENKKAECKCDKCACCKKTECKKDGAEAQKSGCCPKN